jgi:hypothetical protein
MAVLLVLREIGRHKGQKGLVSMALGYAINLEIIKGSEKLIQLEEETLSDGSLVYNVLVSNKGDHKPMVFNCVDEDAAIALFETIRLKAIL